MDGKGQEIRRQILELVKTFYEVEHKPQKDKTFEPGSDRVNYGGRYFDHEELVSLVDSSLDFWLTTGHYADQFEQEFAAKLGVKYSLLVNSGSSANLVAVSTLTSPLLKERRLNKGDEVITVAMGFPTTVNPIIQNGAIPVFVDVC